MDRSFRLYSVVVLVLGLFAVAGLKVASEFDKVGCLPADGRTPAGVWLDACEAPEVGDLSRDYTWYGVDPSIAPSIRKASVLFFGASRILFAASRGGAPEWFNQRKIPFYMLAFEGDERSGWGIKLMRKFSPKPRVAIFDGDKYFSGGFSVPASAIFSDEARERRNVVDLKSFLDRAAPLCAKIKGLCGRKSVVYRSSVDGHAIWPRDPGDRAHIPLYQPPPTKNHFADNQVTDLDVLTKNAADAIAATGVPRQCVILTFTPNEMTDESWIRAVAGRLGVAFVAPRVSGLQTYDFTHYTPAASRIWMAAFLTDAEPIIRRCTQPPAVSPSPHRS